MLQKMQRFEVIMENDYQVHEVIILIMIEVIYALCIDNV